MNEVSPSQIASALHGYGVHLPDPGVSLADVSLANGLRGMRGLPGALILADQTYKISKPLVLCEGQHLVGLGSSATLLYVGAPLADTAALVTLSSGGGLRNVAILGMGLHGVGVRPAPTNSGFTLRDVRVSGFQVGLDLANCYTLVFDNCRFEGNDVGVYLHDHWVMNSTWRGGHIAGNRVGIVVDGVCHIGHHWRTCIEGNSEAGVWVKGGLLCASFKECYFELNGQADISLDANLAGDRAEVIEIEGCNFTSAGQPPASQSQIGIELWVCRQVSIRHNHFSIANPLAIQEGAQATQIGPNLWRIPPLLSKVSGGRDTRFHAGTAAPPAGWFRAD